MAGCKLRFAQEIIAKLLCDDNSNAVNSTRIADEVTLLSLDVSNVENVAVENVVVSLAVRNSINETSKSKEKTQDLEVLIQSFSSPVKRTVSKNLSNSVLSDVVVYADSSSIHEAAVFNSLIDFLKI